MLVEKAMPYSISGNDFSTSLLVLGDSTAVGVGSSKSEDSVPGLLATHLSATYVENRAVSGAVAKDLPSQIAKISQKRYDTILIQIGANDIVQFHAIDDVIKTLESTLVPLKEISPDIIFISAGNLGKAPLVPSILAPFYTKLNLRYHSAFTDFGKKHSITYINMYTDPKVDPFVKDPTSHFAEDSFHPSSLGYKVWFTTIKENIGK